MNTLEKEFEQLELEDKICGICADVKEKEIKLNCNHSYCYDCLYEWFKMKKVKKQFSDKNAILLQCPYCKEKINKIPLLENYTYIRGITNRSVINNQKLQKINNKKESTNNHQDNTNISHNTTTPINIDLTICNAKIKSKNNQLCQKKGKECFGYYCGYHKNYHKINPKVNIN